MIYVCVRTYGNGAWQNKVYPAYFQSLRAAQAKCAELNEKDCGDTDIWILFPLYDADKFV